MKNLLFIIPLIFSLTSCTQKQQYDLVITNVQIFDSKSKTVTAGQTVLITADTIAAIINATAPVNAQQVIDGNGRLLIPGFIDTHIHMHQNFSSSSETAYETISPEDNDLARRLLAHHYLRYGVTTAIDMGQPETWMDATLAWQTDPQPGYSNLFICGGSIVSDRKGWQPPHHIEVMDPNDGRQKVRDYAAKGLKHMKLYRKLKKPDMEAMVDEAQKHNITINTHVDNNVVTIDEAMDYGIRNFEHFFTLTPSILSYDEHWDKMNKRYDIKMNASIDEFTAHMVFFFGYIREHPEYESKLFALFDRMAAESATLSTALNVLASAVKKTDFFTSFEYFPIRRGPETNYNEEQWAQLESAYEAMMYYVKSAHDRGVKLRIGTDCRFGGRALLRELIIFYEAGISIADILQIATYNGYEAMKLTDEYGTIEVGKKADLVLFEKNPFDDYKNFLSKKTIIKGGQIFALKKSLAFALGDVMIDQGTEAGKAWYDDRDQQSEYGPLRTDEMKNTVSELLGSGRLGEAQAMYDIHARALPGDTMKIDGVVLINGTYELLRNGKIEEALSFYEFSQANFPYAETTLPLAVLMAMLEKDADAGAQRFSEIKDNDRYAFNEDEMNGVGYLLMQLDRMDQAIAIFKLNAASFPDSWNAYDSLGEAYMNAGDHKAAISNYEKSIELNPDNTYGKEQVRKMKRL